MLRSMLGPEVYTSWFGLVELVSLEGETVRMSVPSRFVASRIDSEYANAVLTCWQQHHPAVKHVQLIIREQVGPCT